MPLDIHEVVRALRGDGPLLILPHDNPDPDALAAALGLERIAALADCPACIALGGIIGRAENRAFVRELDIRLVPLARLDFGRFPRVALVDTQPGAGNNSLPAGRTPDLVIDHHPPREASHAARWCDIRAELGVSSVIVLEYLRRLNVPLDAALATAFFYAIRSETRDLGREHGEALRQTFLELFPLADHEKLYRIAHPKLAREHFRALDRALRVAEVRGALITVNLGALEYPDLVAEVADLLLSYERAHWVLCVGQHEGEVYLSIRTDVVDAHAGQLMQRLVAGRGAGGGHGMIAGGRIFGEVRDEKQLAALHADLAARMARELDEKGPAAPLLGAR